MSNKSTVSILYCTLILWFTGLYPGVPDAFGQTQTRKDSEPLWFTKLYETDIKYGDSACSIESSQVINLYFEKHPLNRRISICHNNCPVVKCKPVIAFPSAAAAVRVTGEAAVHILVDESGKVLYARILTGNPLLTAAVKKAACETRFNDYDSGYRQGVMHFEVNNYQYLTIPFTANLVTW